MDTAVALQQRRDDPIMAFVDEARRRLLTSISAVAPTSVPQKHTSNNEAAVAALNAAQRQALECYERAILVAWNMSTCRTAFLDVYTRGMDECSTRASARLRARLSELDPYWQSSVTAAGASPTLVSAFADTLDQVCLYTKTRSVSAAAAAQSLRLVCAHFARALMVLSCAGETFLEALFERNTASSGDGTFNTSAPTPLWFVCNSSSGSGANGNRAPSAAIIQRTFNERCFTYVTQHYLAVRDDLTVTTSSKDSDAEVKQQQQQQQKEQHRLAALRRQLWHNILRTPCGIRIAYMSRYEAWATAQSSTSSTDDGNDDWRTLRRLFVNQAVLEALMRPVEESLIERSLHSELRAALQHRWNDALRYDAQLPLLMLLRAARTDNMYAASVCAHTRVAIRSGDARLLVETFEEMHRQYSAAAEEACASEELVADGNGVANGQQHRKHQHHYKRIPLGADTMSVSVSASEEDADTTRRHSNAYISLPPYFFCAANTLLLLAQHLHSSVIAAATAPPSHHMHSSRNGSNSELANTLYLLHSIHQAACCGGGVDNQPSPNTSSGNTGSTTAATSSPPSQLPSPPLDGASTAIDAMLNTETAAATNNASGNGLLAAIESVNQLDHRVSTVLVAALILCWQRYAVRSTGAAAASASAQDSVLFEDAHMHWALLLNDMRALQPVSSWLAGNVTWRIRSAE